MKARTNLAIRDAALGFVALLVVVATFYAATDYFDSRLAARVATGQKVTARVVSATAYWELRTDAERLVVTYSLNNKEYRAPLMWLVSMPEDKTIRTGDFLDIYVDTTDPTRIATSDGAGSEGWWLRLPTIGGALLFAAVLAVMVIRVRWHMAE